LYFYKPAFSGGSSTITNSCHATQTNTNSDSGGVH